MTYRRQWRNLAVLAAGLVAFLALLGYVDPHGTLVLRVPLAVVLAATVTLAVDAALGGRRGRDGRGGRGD
ncbi:MAG: hypothetical protein QOK43_1826 [Acidimicrobiaceae bacterium]|nr:hypothetical protein [Acidimicrobiaceae bacterium]